MGANTVVTLSATPDTGLSTTWTGCDSFSGNSCTVTMSTKKSVTATFADVTPPASPTNIETQTPTTKGQLITTWTNPSDTDFSHIHIYRSTILGTVGSLIADTQTGIKYTDTGLSSQTKYYYTVRSVDTAGNESTNTTQASDTTLDATAPSFVGGGVAADATTGGKLNLSWNAPPETDVAYYRIYRSNDGGISYTLAHNNVVGTTYSDTGLTNGTRYYYSFTAVDTSGNESEQSSTHGLVYGKPTAPDTTPPAVISCTGTITQPSPLTGDKLQLTWINPADSDYALTRIYASTGSGLGTLIYEGTGTSYLHTGLTANTTYKYTYRSVDTAGNETTNTTTCDYTPVDLAAPACPTELKATRNGDNSITLTWNRSTSSDIYSYQIFASAADAAVTYTAPTATILSPAVTWTSSALTQGKSYQFGIRTVDSLLTSPNISSNCGVITASIPNPLPACDVSTSIKVPHTGKKLGGNRTTVIAEVTTGNETNLSSILFQYRPSGIANSWTNIPSTDNVTFPNPDTTKPWFVHWDITGLTDNSDYDIRAVATCTNTSQDATPGYITVAVNRSNPDSDEDDNIDGEHQKTETVGGDADCHIVKGNDTDKGGVTSLSLPAGSTPEGTHVTVTESNPATKAALVPADFESGNCFREITFDDGRHYLDNNKKAELAIPYKDDDNDGVVDGTTINVHDLQICDYDSINKIWNCLDSTVDTTTKTVKAKSSTFSLFGLLAPPKPLSAGWNLVSVPLTPTPADPAAVFGSNAFFYDPITATYPVMTTVSAYDTSGNESARSTAITAKKATPTATTADGDIDGDGRITIIDAIRVLRMALGLDKTTTIAKAHGDMDNDGRLTVRDALMLIRKAVGL